MEGGGLADRLLLLQILAGSSRSRGRGDDCYWPSGILMKMFEMLFAEYYHDDHASVREPFSYVNQRLLDIHPLIGLERLPCSTVCYIYQAI